MKLSILVHLQKDHPRGLDQALQILHGLYLSSLSTTKLTAFTAGALKHVRQAFS
jgi:hypothetical protein